jgi:hypothetical protein
MDEVTAVYRGECAVSTTSWRGCMPEKTKPALRRVTDGLLPHQFRGRSHQPLRAVSGDSIPIATNDSVACGSGQRTTGNFGFGGASDVAYWHIATNTYATACPLALKADVAIPGVTVGQLQRTSHLHPARSNTVSRLDDSKGYQCHNRQTSCAEAHHPFARVSMSRPKLSAKRYIYLDQKPSGAGRKCSTVVCFSQALVASQ